MTTRDEAVPHPTASVTFDARPLTEPVDREAVRAYTRAAQATAGRRTSATAVITIVIVVIIAATAIPVFLAVGFGIVGGFLSIVDSAAGTGFTIASVIAGFLPLILLGLVFGAVAFLLVRGTLAGRERSYRLDRFARANGMSYFAGLDDPGLPGMIFGVGSARAASDLVRGEQPRFVEFANYTYTTGSGKNRTTHRWGYVAVKLDVPLPHIVLDATSNNSLFGSNLPMTFDGDQRLSLEGDFDEHFALYCPSGYERDALYLFTPDIMARFIDNAAALDVEIVDDWLFLYGRRDFSTLDPATWAWLFSVVAALLDKLAQWARWRDERLQARGRTDAAGSPPGTSAAGHADPLPFDAPLPSLRPPPGVAQGGRRLSRGFPWAGIVIIAVFLLLWLLGQVGVFGAFGTLLR